MIPIGDNPYACNYTAEFSSHGDITCTSTVPCAIATFTLSKKDECTGTINTTVNPLTNKIEYDTDNDSIPNYIYIPLHVYHSEYIGIFFDTPILLSSTDRYFSLSINGIEYKPCDCIDHQDELVCPIKHDFRRLATISLYDRMTIQNDTLLYGLYVPRIISPLYKTIQFPFPPESPEFIYYGYENRHMLEYLEQFQSRTHTIFQDYVRETLLSCFPKEILDMSLVYMGHDIHM